MRCKEIYMHIYMIVYICVVCAQFLCLKQMCGSIMSKEIVVIE